MNIDLTVYLDSVHLTGTAHDLELLISALVNLFVITSLGVRVPQTDGRFFIIIGVSGLRNHA